MPVRSKKESVKIPLTQGHYALIDKEDLSELSKYKFHIDKGYVSTSKWIKEEKRVKHFRIHNILMAPSQGLEVDHINGDPLDNRKENLRIVTHSQNMMNSKISKNNTSGYKGVSFNIARNKWQVHIMDNKKEKCVGYFNNKIEAAKVYNQEALKYYGEFAKLNYINE